MNLKTQLTEKRFNTHKYFQSELVKLILYGHTKFEDDSVLKGTLSTLNFYGHTELISQAHYKNIRTGVKFPFS